MSTNQPTISTFFNTRFKFGFGRFNLEAERQIWSAYVPAPTSSDAETVPVTDTVNRFASMAGMLADHPLRGEWLREMGLSPDNDLEVA
jgi:hypothetical protein